MRFNFPAISSRITNCAKVRKKSHQTDIVGYHGSSNEILMSVKVVANVVQVHLEVTIIKSSDVWKRLSPMTYSISANQKQ